MKIPSAFAILTLLAIQPTPLLRANVTLPGVIANNMVIQRDRPATVWGWADPGETVTVRLGDQLVGTAKGEGKERAWRVSLPPQKAGPIADITISGKNSITLTNLLAGEVWICSGQSNMEMTLVKGPWCGFGGVIDAVKEASANDPQLRIFKVERGGAPMPSVVVTGTWAPANPEILPRTSATGYFFGRELRAKLNVPVGLVISAVGGTAIELWTPAKALEGDKEYAGLHAKAKAIHDQYGVKAAEDRAALEQWKKQSAEATGSGQPVPPKPPLQLTPEQSLLVSDSAPILGAGGFYNGKIHPLAPMTIRGAIWYQGEANAHRGELYAHSLTKLIESWRGAFGQQFPFLIVQLANFGSPILDDPKQGSFALVREAEAKVAETTPGAGLVTAVDIGNPRNIHPANKQEVGRRLGQLALKQVYGQDVVAGGPLFASARFEAGKGVVSFKRESGDLVLKGTDGFEVAGADKKFVAAIPVLKGNAIEVSAPGVAKPVAVRYAFLNAPKCSVFNAQGWPALPFRSDHW